ncbi:hypothetical protein C0Z16_05980 [Paraburkholderia rhynchosiae]|uniref:Uncharacterized protein n=1 Tax=Paraburkholderia rhynchosiae TaxID=487049 RepID=A0ABX4VA75_9BURK|nr:hypothetical protein C0Z16_05980 [Paraburkholderia rhynchosiae]
MFQLIVRLVWFGGVHAKPGPREKFAAKPMLRIVNMQKRLRPVYPGLWRDDFAMDIRDVLLLDPPRWRRFTRIADYFGI